MQTVLLLICQTNLTTESNIFNLPCVSAYGKLLGLGTGEGRAVFFCIVTIQKPCSDTLIDTNKVHIKSRHHRSSIIKHFVIRKISGRDLRGVGQYFFGIQVIQYHGTYGEATHTVSSTSEH